MKMVSVLAISAIGYVAIELILLFLDFSLVTFASHAVPDIDYFSCIICHQYFTEKELLIEHHKSHEIWSYVQTLCSINLVRLDFNVCPHIFPTQF